LETVIKVSLNGRVLNLEYLFIPHETIDIPSELHLLYRTYLWDSLYSYCQSGISEKVRLSFPDIPRHIIVTSLDPIVEFKDNHTNFYFITRNPSYAQSQCWAYPSGRKDFFIKILYSGGPLYKVGCEPYGPPLHSILVAGDTIHREFILSLSSKNYLELAEDSLFTSPLIQML